ncbi:hypothetical protein Tco_0464963, partial [Tanacetum coccineum]
TSASGSKPLGNTKNDRISRPPSSNEKNKVEVPPRKVKSCLNKKNYESKNVCNEHVKHSVVDAKALYFVCNECLFDANHAICLIDHVNSMNVRDKSAFKKNTKRKEWKPTRKLFNFVGYKWKPTGRTFTLVGNACPLTRITATNKVPLRVPFLLKMEPDTSRGSDTSVAPSSSSLIDCRLSKFFCGDLIGFYTTQADGAQSPRVPVPFLEDPYKAIRQACLVRTDTESEPFEDPVETEEPESPHTVAPPTSLHDSTPPTLVPILRRTARMAVHVPPAMSPGLFASIAEVEAMSDSAFCKRFRSSYKSSPSSSPPDLPSWKRYRGTSELVEDDMEEDDDEEEDEEIEESSDSDSESQDAEDEGPTIEDEDPAVGDEGLAAGDKGLASVVETSVGEPLGLGYKALRRREIALGEGRMLESDRPKRVSALRQPTLTTWINPEDGIAYIDVPAYPPPVPPAQTSPSPEWSFGLLHVSPAPSTVPLPISSPMIPLTIPLLVASPAMAETEGFLTELGAQVEMQGGLIHDNTIRLGELSPALFERYDRDIWELFTRPEAVRDEIFSQRYRFRSLKHKQERVAVNFGAIWRPILALESWAGQ